MIPVFDRLNAILAGRSPNRPSIRWDKVVDIPCSSHLLPVDPVLIGANARGSRLSIGDAANPCHGGLIILLDEHNWVFSVLVIYIGSTVLCLG